MYELPYQVLFCFGGFVFITVVIYSGDGFLFWCVVWGALLTHATLNLNLTG